MPVLIGLHGRRGAGKDTAFGYIKSWAEGRGLRAERRGFADLLKLSAYRIFKPDCTMEEAVEWCNRIKWDDHQIIVRQYGYEEVEGDNWLASITGREFLQHYGTEAHRDVFDENFWVNALLPMAINGDWRQNWPDGTDFAVVTDLRFRNEAQRIHALGGYVFAVERPTASTDTHSSEVPLPGSMIDEVIQNDASLDKLNAEVASMMAANFHMKAVKGLL